MNVINIGDATFEVIDKLGQGSFGDVFKVKKGNKNYALKVIKNPAKEGIKSLKEIDIMRRIVHPNLNEAEMVISGYDKNDVVTGILMEIAEKDMHKILTDKKFTIEKRLDILNQVTSGLKYLHDSNYLHLDIKPLNILIFKGWKAKLTDFGLALVLEDINGKKIKYYPNPLMTIDHRSIEALEGNRNYTSADDVWSLGITFLETLSMGKSLFTGFEKDDFTDDKVKEVFIDYLSPNVIKTTLNNFLRNLENSTRTRAINLISKMLEFDPSKRATVEEILSSPLFKKMNQNGKRVQPPIFKSDCDYMVYEGFDTLVRISTRIPISLETFFLAVDIYQRSLIYGHPKTGNFDQDYRNMVYTASISLYIAAKMIESYFIDPELIVSLAGNFFTADKLIFGESFITNNLEGIIYPDNLFTSSSTLNRLNIAFDISRNCFLYRKIDLNKWKILSDKEGEKYDKYISFNTFLGQTEYYKLVLEDPDRKYIKELYEKDRGNYENNI
jgi:serine/threonine protein kinase